MGKKLDTYSYIQNKPIRKNFRFVNSTEWLSRKSGRRIIQPEESVVQEIKQNIKTSKNHVEKDLKNKLNTLKIYFYFYYFFIT